MEILRCVDCVEYELRSIEVFMRWEYCGLLYVGEGKRAGEGRELVRQGQGIEIKP